MIRPDEHPEEYHETLSAGDEIDSLAIALGIVAAAAVVSVIAIAVSLARIAITY